MAGESLAGQPESTCRSREVEVDHSRDETQTAVDAAPVAAEEEEAGEVHETAVAVVPAGTKQARTAGLWEMETCLDVMAVEVAPGMFAKMVDLAGAVAAAAAAVAVAVEQLVALAEEEGGHAGHMS